MLPVKNWTLAIAILCVMAVAGLAQPPQRQAPDRLGRLKAALAEAGAPELSSTQVTQLEAAIKAFHDAIAAETPDATIGAAEKAYQQAILDGNSGAAGAQVTIIANAIASRTKSHRDLETTAKIAVLNVLKSNAQQISALTARFGSVGIYGLVSGLIGGGPGGRGPGGPGFGPGGPGFSRPGGPGGGPNGPPMAPPGRPGEQ
jgi:hypothetical protein